MRNVRRLFCTVAVFMLIAFVSSAQAQIKPKIGLRGGVGTDINGGLAYGGGVNFLLTYPRNSLELGIVLFGGSFDESTDEGIHTYDETTDILVFGALANYLISYQPGEPGTFFIVGIGLASVSVDWEERSATDVSLGTPLPGGGSMQSEEGSGGGTVFNLGFGYSFPSGIDIRAELPTIVSFSSPGEAASVIPTAMVTAGIRF